MTWNQLTFYICVAIAAICYVFFWYKFKSWDYLVGTMVGGLCLALIVLGASSYGL